MDIPGLAYLVIVLFKNGIVIFISEGVPLVT